MNKSVIYIVGATVLVGGGAYLFLKNKKKKDAITLAGLENKLNGTTSGGTTTNDGVSSSNSNINLVNATVLVGQRNVLLAQMKQPCGFSDAVCIRNKNIAKIKLPIIESQLAKLGYKVEGIGQLVKI